MITDSLPQIVTLQLKELIIIPELAWRTKAELTQYAKELAPAIEAFGGWDASQAGSFFMRGGKPHLSKGFTRTTACLALGIKTGCFVEVPDDPERLRTEGIRSNLHNRPDRREQGRHYVEMRDGTKDITAVKEGDPIFAPMEIKEIVEQIGGSISRQHVESCICLFEESPEIAALIDAEKVSYNVVLAAKVVKAAGKRLAFLKAAIAEAEKEGKTCATPAHLKAVKDQFVEQKSKASAKANKPASKSPVPSQGALNLDAEKDSSKSDSVPPEHKSKPRPAGEASGNTSSHNLLVQSLRDLIEAWDKDGELEASQTESLAEALIAGGVTIA